MGGCRTLCALRNRNPGTRARALQRNNGQAVFAKIEAAATAKRSVSPFTRTCGKGQRYGGRTPSTRLACFPVYTPRSAAAPHGSSQNMRLAQSSPRSSISRWDTVAMP